MNYVNLVVDNNSRHTDELYTYAFDEPLSPGQIVNIPFGRSKGHRRGFVFQTGVDPEIDPARIRKIESVDGSLSLNGEMIETICWMRRRYGIRYMDGVKCFVPHGKPPAPGKEKEPYKNARGESQPVETLTDEQQRVTDIIGAAIREGREERFLIHGVTGSGKTEVYMRAIEQVLAMGKGAIMLVPEIALTKQIVERFIGRFGKKRIAVMHSKLTGRERFDEWMRIRRGEARIVIGARIGVFAPMENIGAIILDEEHEATYKSDQTPKYETLDVAVRRLMHYHGVLLLGSATPSVVSYQRAKEGIYSLLEMKHRYNAVPLPVVEIVDMRKELRRGNRTMFSNQLYHEMKRTLAAGEQVILFLNRRGYSTFIACKECGEVLKCPECGISLVYHKGENAAICHYCGKKFAVPARCPSCGGENIRFSGVGTEQVEEFTARQFPDYVVNRLDLDTAKKTKEINGIIGDFAKGKTDILIGTQLVAKGLDFRNVGLVGVVAADVSLNIPDYRATERTFQLVTQVAGRAGRGARQGRVIVQTGTPDNFALLAAAQHDYKSFFRQEIMVRRFMNYPPFSDLIAAEFTAGTEELASSQADRCKDYLVRAGLPGAERIFAPKLSGNFKGQDSFRYHILIKCPRGERGRYIYYLRFFAEQMTKNRIECSMTIDVNPYSML